MESVAAPFLWCMYLQVAPVQVAFPIGEANSKSSKKHATDWDFNKPRWREGQGENLLIFVSIEETLHHQH